MELEPHEVERMDPSCQKAHQGWWAMVGIWGKLAIQEGVELAEDEAEDWG